MTFVHAAVHVPSARLTLSLSDECSATRLLIAGSCGPSGDQINEAKCLDVGFRSKRVAFIYQNLLDGSGDPQTMGPSSSSNSRRHPGSWLTAAAVVLALLLVVSPALAEEKASKVAPAKALVQKSSIIASAGETELPNGIGDVLPDGEELCWVGRVDEPLPASNLSTSDAHHARPMQG